MKALFQFYRKRVYVAAVVLLCGLAALWGLRYAPVAAPVSVPDDARVCVEETYARQHKAAVNRILEGAHDWKAVPLENYAGIRRLHAEILAQTQAAAGRDDGCGAVTAAQVADIVAVHRAARPVYDRTRDALCLAVYMRQSGFNPCAY